MAFSKFTWGRNDNGEKFRDLYVIGQEKVVCPTLIRIEKWETFGVYI